jgi:hypothetical protein
MFGAITEAPWTSPSASVTGSRPAATLHSTTRRNRIRTAKPSSVRPRRHRLRRAAEPCRPGRGQRQRAPALRTCCVLACSYYHHQPLPPRPLLGLAVWAKAIIHHLLPQKKNPTVWLRNCFAYTCYYPVACQMSGAMPVLHADFTFPGHRRTSKMHNHIY